MPSMIEKLYQEGELTIRKKNLKHGYTVVRNINKTYMISKTEKPCFICHTLTKRIDVFAEIYICGDECERKFYKEYVEKAEEE